MAAMMQPGAAPAVVRVDRAGGVREVPLFAGSYLAIWALAGAVVSAVYRPHGTIAADAVAIVPSGLKPRLTAPTSRFLDSSQ